MTNPRNLSMYLSTNPSEFQDLFYTQTTCDFIHSTAFRGGTLYCLGHTNPPKSHLTLDNMLKSMEYRLDQGTGAPIFQLISDDLSKKVKTFSVGQHAANELYRAIFSNTVVGGRGVRTVHPNVSTWRHQRDETNACSGTQSKTKKRKRVVAAEDVASEYNGTVDELKVQVAEMRQAISEKDKQCIELGGK